METFEKLHRKMNNDAEEKTKWSFATPIEKIWSI